MRALKRSWLWLAVAALAVVGCEPEGVVRDREGSLGKEAEGQPTDVSDRQAPGQRGDEAGGSLDEPPTGKAPPTEPTAHPTASMRGTVKQIEAAKGELTLDTDAGPQTLHVRPFDVDTLTPGEIVQVTYGRYGDQMWVIPAEGWEQASRKPEEETRMTGTIDEMDRTAGTMTVSGRKLRVHPHQLAALRPGQTVDATLVMVAGQSWILTVRPSVGAPRGT